jgi:predicted esterase
VGGGSTVTPTATGGVLPGVRERSLQFASAAALLLVIACQSSAGQRRRPPVVEPGTATDVTIASSEGSPHRASLPEQRRDDEARGVPSITALDVPGFLPAVVVVPAGDDERPLVVAAHGAGGSPEWECDYWSRLTRGGAFVLCLRGTRMGEGAFYYKHHHALAGELDAAVPALRRRFARASSRGGIYAGFSQGASMGALMIADRSAQFPYVVLIEGFVQWNVALGRKFAEHGGQAVLWVCGTRDCSGKAEASARALDQAHVRARAQSLPGAGHTPVGPVMNAVAENLTWLLGDDPVWHYLAR